MLKMRSSDDSSVPPTMRNLESGDQVTNETPFAWHSNDFNCFRWWRSGSTSQMIQNESFDPVANLRPFGENLQNQTSSECSLSTYIEYKWDYGCELIEPNLNYLNWVNRERVRVVGTVMVTQQWNVIDRCFPGHVVVRTLLCLKFDGLSQQRVKTARWQHNAGWQIWL